MLRGMNKGGAVTIVGPGRLGSALAHALMASGFSIALIVSRNDPNSARRAAKLANEVGARSAKLDAADFHSEIVWFCVPDNDIAHIAGIAAKKWNGKFAFHSSGALSSDELKKLQEAGASVASVHPLMTFAGRSMVFTGVPFGLEGEKAAVLTARRVVKALGGIAFAVSKKNKSAYHAWGMFASPLLISLLRSAEDVAGLAGVKNARALMSPIVHQTIANYFELGPEGAFTGPIVRGDADTVKKHLRALRGAKQLRSVYLALASSAVQFLPTANRKKLTKLLSNL